MFKSVQVKTKISDESVLTQGFSRMFKSVQVKSSKNKNLR